MTAQAVQPVAHARFVPASKLDFTRYAKNLAWLLERPLQECQEILSRIYGYEHLHELQANLDRGLPPGPYWDEGAEEMGEGARDANPYDGRPVLPACFSGQRSFNAVGVLLKWKANKGERGYLESHEDLITDLGLTDSPASHRDCVRRVKLYIDGTHTIDQHGWPTAFWSYMHRYDPRQFGPFSTAAIREAFGVVHCGTFPISTRDHYACSHLDLAVDVVQKLSEGVETDGGSNAFEFFSDSEEWPMFWDALSKHSNRHTTWEEECIEWLFGAADGVDDDDPRIAFVRWPGPKTYKNSGIKTPYAAAVEEVRKWRNAWLVAAARAWREDHPQIFVKSETRVDEERRFSSHDLGHLMMRAALKRNYSGDSVTEHRLSATMAMKVKEQENVIIAAVKGWIFSPCAGNTYTDGNELDYAISEMDSVIEDGWDLVKRYMTIRGIPDMDTWVNSGEGCAMLVGQTTFAPGHSSTEQIARLCKMISDASAEPDHSSEILISEHAYWENQLPGNQGDHEDLDDSAFIKAPGVIVLEIEGLKETGFLIGNEDGVGHQIIVLGGVRKGSRGHARDMRGWGRPKNKAANDDYPHVRAILEQIGDATVDIILTGSLSEPFPVRQDEESAAYD